MNVNCLNEDAPFEIFKTFGFTGGKDTDKFKEITPYHTLNGLALLPYVNAFMSLKVESYGFFCFVKIILCFLYFVIKLPRVIYMKGIFKFETDILKGKNIHVNKNTDIKDYIKHRHNYYEIIYYSGCVGECILKLNMRLLLPTKTLSKSASGSDVAQQNE